MQDLKSLLLLLIRMGLWGTEKFPNIKLSEEEWKYIYQQSCIQTVQGIVYDAIQTLPLNLQPSKMLQIAWAIEIGKIERANREQLEILNELTHYYYNEIKVPFKLIKGQAIACHYSHGNHRVCGDIDLWIASKKNFELANSAIESNNIHIERGGNLDSIYAYKNVEIEHHYSLIELHNPFIKKSIEEWSKLIYEQDALVPGPEAHLLLQVTHILKHQLNEGIGLRQICDLAVCIKSFKYDKEEFKRLVKEYGVYRWTQLLFALLHNCLGVEEEILPFPLKGNSDILLKEIWATGNFGQYDIRFGKRPQGFWKGKLFTANIMLHKAKIFFYYAPEESFWNLISLAKMRIHQLYKGQI